MGIRTVIILSIIAMALGLMFLFIWIDQRRQQKRLRAIARYNRERQQQNRQEPKGPRVVEIGNKRVIIDPLVAGFDDDIESEESDEDFSGENPQPIVTRSNYTTVSTKRVTPYTKMNSSIKAHRPFRSESSAMAHTANAETAVSCCPHHHDEDEFFDDEPAIVEVETKKEQYQHQLQDSDILAQNKAPQSFRAERLNPDINKSPFTQSLQTEQGNRETYQNLFTQSSQTEQGNPELNQNSSSQSYRTEQGNPELNQNSSSQSYRSEQGNPELNQNSSSQSYRAGQGNPEIKHNPSPQSLRAERGNPEKSQKPFADQNAPHSINSTQVGQRSTATSPLPNYITFSLMAEKDRPFGGYELLQSILGVGLRHGERQIFHRYDNEDPTKILFSLASIAKPGTFSLESMGSFSTPGLIFIFEIERTPELLNSFELLLESSRQLSDELDGTLLDDRREPLTTERIQTLRQQLRELTPGQDYFDEH